jgi:CheY-like chemotaxis protein/anti-sigma regulatory factor (Ser/Thr protein kinase)
LIEARGHQLTTRMVAGDVRVLGDRTRLVQVIANLLNNAAKYTPLNGALSLSLAAGKQVEVRVTDTGMGIEQQLLPHVFELFTQGERTPDRAQGGLGLGLALVKSLVELHGGQVVAESHGRGQGSAFIVTLPSLADDASEASASQESAGIPHPSQALRVMVVDDNRDAGETLGMLLESLGHKVRVMHDGVQALNAIEHTMFDTFVLDIGLPDMDGFVLAARLRAHPNCSAATFIALTGYGSAHDRNRGEEAGFDHYLVKPANLVELARALEQP